MAKVKALPTPARPLPDDDADDEDCPRCPPVGAPVWMATFADIAVLLMAFFVLILSFANFDEVSFKKMTGALREHFGTNLIEIMPNPESTTVLEMDFRPAATPPAPEDAPDPDTSAASAPADDPAMDALAQALAEALEQAGSSASVVDGQLMLSVPDAASTLAEALQDAAPELAVQQGRPDAADGTGSAGDNSTRRAAIAEARLSVALRELQDQGLVDVQREQEKVIVTVGAGGAFQSGSADLTDDARAIMARIALASAGDRGVITVTGHTDSVPLAGGPFVDNWGLAAARASSVVRELGASGMIAPDRLTAISRGETMPVAENTTEDGRATNRRIEIEFDFAKTP